MGKVRTLLHALFFICEGRSMLNEKKPASGCIAIDANFRSRHWRSVVPTAIRIPKKLCHSAAGAASFAMLLCGKGCERAGSSSGSKWNYRNWKRNDAFDRETTLSLPLSHYTWGEKMFEKLGAWKSASRRVLTTYLNLLILKTRIARGRCLWILFLHVHRKEK